MANLWSVAPSLHSAAYILGKFYELSLRNGTLFWPECATCVSIYLPCSAHPFPGREENWRAKAARHSTNNLYLQGEHSSTRFLPSSDSHKFLFPNCRCRRGGVVGFLKPGGIYRVGRLISRNILLNIFVMLRLLVLTLEAVSHNFMSRTAGW